METATRTGIGAADFYADPHATKYQAELEANPNAFRILFDLLNLPANPDFSVVRGCEGPVFRGNAFLVWNTGC